MSYLTLSRRVHFSSGHQYAHPDWSPQKNKEVFGSSFSSHGHGHNYILEAHIQGPVCPDTGMIMNLSELDSILKIVSDELDHKHLNLHVPYFKTKIPTTENIAQYFFDQITDHLIKKPKLKLFKVRVFEGEDLWADIYG